MSVRASSTARELLRGVVSVYLEDDRVEVGLTNTVCQEELQRIAYRDVRRIVSWPDTRRVALGLGGVLSLLGLIGLLVAVVDGTSGIAVVGVFAGVFLVLGLMSLYSGRPGGITRIRIEGVRRSLDAVLAGSAKKRARVLADLEQRVRDRQSIR